MEHKAVFRTTLEMKKASAFALGPGFTYHFEFWRARLGSNQQPLPSEGSTLSIELRARIGRDAAQALRTERPGKKPEPNEKNQTKPAPGKSESIPCFP
jgi:hypothetical protein